MHRRLIWIVPDNKEAFKVEFLRVPDAVRTWSSVPKKISTIDKLSKATVSLRELKTAGAISLINDLYLLKRQNQ